MFLTLFGMGKYQGTILWSFIIFKHQQLTFTSCLLCLCSILSLFLLYKWGNGSSVKLGNPDQAHRASRRGNWNSATAAWLQVCHAKPFLSHTGALLEQFLSCESSLLGVLDKVCGLKRDWIEQKEGQWAWGAGNDGKSETSWNWDWRVLLLTFKYSIKCNLLSKGSTNCSEAMGVIRGWGGNAYWFWPVSHSICHEIPFFL